MTNDLQAQHFQKGLHVLTNFGHFTELRYKRMLPYLLRDY